MPYSKDVRSTDFEGKCEEMHQKIHELTLQRNANRMTIASMEADIECAREARKKSFEETKLGAINKHTRQLKLLKQQLVDLEDDIQQLQSTEESLKQINSENLRHNKTVDISIIEEEKSMHILQCQIDSILEENVKLSADTATIDGGVQKLFAQIACLEKSVQEAHSTVAEQSETIAELESNLTSLQDEKQMLLLLQESKHFAAVDPNKKGNSMFAEMDDHRRLVEERVTNLQKRCETQAKTNEVLEAELRRLTDRMEQQMMMSQVQMPPHLRKLETEFEQIHAEQWTVIRQQLNKATKVPFDMTRIATKENLSSMLTAKRFELRSVQQCLQNERFLITVAKDQLGKASQCIKQLQRELEVEKNAETSLLKKIRMKEEVCSVNTGECAPPMDGVNTLNTNITLIDCAKTEPDNHEKGDTNEYNKNGENTKTYKTAGQSTRESGDWSGKLLDTDKPKKSAVRFSANSPVAISPVTSVNRDSKRKCVNVKDMQTCNQQ